MLKINIMSDRMHQGLNIMEGYIEFECEYNKNVMIQKYFKLQYDSTVNDYDYSGSDITEDQEELLHECIINNKYDTPEDEESLYKYSKASIVINDRYKHNDIKEIGLKESIIKVFINSKGFIHLIKSTFELFNDSKCRPCETEFMFNKNKRLKEIGYNIL